MARAPCDVAVRWVDAHPYLDFGRVELCRGLDPLSFQPASRYSAISAYLHSLRHRSQRTGRRLFKLTGQLAARCREPSMS